MKANRIMILDKIEDQLKVIYPDHELSVLEKKAIEKPRAQAMKNMAMLCDIVAYDYDDADVENIRKFIELFQEGIAVQWLDRINRALETR